MAESAAPKSVKRATRDYGVLCKSSNSPLTKSGAKLVSIALSDANGTRQASEKTADVFHWLVTVTPPADSLYAGKDYDILLMLSPTEYPFIAPIAAVKTSIYSPIVSPTDGKLCEGLLRNDAWQPTTPPLEVIDLVCEAVFTKFGELEVLNEEAARLYHEDKAAFQKRVAAAKAK